MMQTQIVRYRYVTDRCLVNSVTRNTVGVDITVRFGGKGFPLVFAALLPKCAGRQNVLGGCLCIRKGLLDGLRNPLQLQLVRTSNG